MENPDKREEIYKKLITTFDSNVETLARILFYIGEEDKQFIDHIDLIPPVLRILKASLNNDIVFKTYAERLAEDTKKAENDEVFRNILNKIYSQMLEPSDEPLKDDFCKDLDIARFTDVKVKTSGFTGLAYAWDIIPTPTRNKILEMIPVIISDKQLVSSVDEFVTLVNKTSGTLVMYGLATIYLSYEAIKNLIRWWKGEISGKRCAKNIVDSMFTISAGIGCGVGGAILGTFFGPFGTFFGGIGGGIAGSAFVNGLIDKVTQWIFDLPQDEALENAYNFIGVNKDASNHEINMNFRKLCLKHHPDKGGDKENFLLVQIHMGVIKLARHDLI